MKDHHLTNTDMTTRILIVDDESAIRNSMAEYMQSVGYVTYIAE